MGWDETWEQEQRLRSRQVRCSQRLTEAHVAGTEGAHGCWWTLRGHRRCPPSVLRRLSPGERERPCLENVLGEPVCQRSTRGSLL